MKNYIRLFLILVLSISFTGYTAAQETNEPEENPQQQTGYDQQNVNADNAPPPESFWQKVRFGGGFGLNFGQLFNITLAPNAIYQFNSYVSAGIGLNGIYAGEQDVYTATVLGGSVIGLFNPIREIQLSSEFEVLNVNRDFEPVFENAGFQDENYWYPALFLGIGYNPGFMTIGVRYDVLYDSEKSIYGNALMPFVRLSF